MCHSTKMQTWSDVVRGAGACRPGHSPFQRFQKGKDRGDTPRLRSFCKGRFIASGSIATRHLFLHVIHRAIVIVFRPHPLHTPTFCPPDLCFLKFPPFIHRLAHPALEPLPHILSLHLRAQHVVHMIRRSRGGPMLPSTAHADARYNVFDEQTLLDRQHARGKFQPGSLNLLPFPARSDNWLSELIHRPVNRPALVAVQAGSISSPRDVVCERRCHVRRR